jgi:glycine oxidase
MKVIVIGAGAAGLGIGWRLAQQGVQTVVVERAQPGRGATWAAAGMIAAANRKTRPSTPEAELARDAAIRWPDFAAELEQASGHAISYVATGKLDVAQTQDEREALAADAGPHAGTLLTAAAAREIEPRLRPDIAGALWNANEAKVDNRALGPALAAAFERAGGSLLVNETVVRFEFHDSRIHGVRTPFALHQGDAYVLAAGAWSARIEGLPPEALPPIVPVKGEMLALEPPTGEALPSAVIGGRDTYMVVQRDRLLVGATVARAGFDSSLTAAASDWLLARATGLIPGLRDWDIAEHWAGLRPGSPDDLPLLGQSALDALFIASGQFRSGILYTPVIADALSALVLQESVPLDIAAFDPRRFGTTSAGGGEP